MRIPSLLLISIALLTSISCSTGACYDNQNSLPKAGFYASGDDRQAISISGLSIGGQGAPNDSLLCKPSESASEVYLPFRPNEGSTSFVFKYGEVSDVVTFTYETTPYFASADCGAVWRFQIRSVNWIGNLIDSIAVTDSVITNVDAQQLKIFFNTQENGTEEEPDEE